MSSNEQYNMLNYYSEKMTYWDRNAHDTRKAIFPHLYTFEKMFPIPATPKDFKLLKSFGTLADQLVDILKVAPHRLTWPSCLRCFCCKTKKRTSCCCFYTVLFGRIK